MHPVVSGVQQLWTFWRSQRRSQHFAVWVKSKVRRHQICQNQALAKPSELASPLHNCAYATGHRQTSLFCASLKFRGLGTAWICPFKDLHRTACLDLQLFLTHQHHIEIHSRLCCSTVHVWFYVVLQDANTRGACSMWIHTVSYYCSSMRFCTWGTLWICENAKPHEQGFLKNFASV